jgi:hypothetical protein
VLHTKSDDGTFRAARGGFVSLGSWMNDVVRQLAASPHCTSAPPADFYVVPMAFDSGMKGRHDAADVARRRRPSSRKKNCCAVKCWL